MRKHKNKKDFILTKKKAVDIFLILSQARIKLKGKVQTSADNYWKEFEDALGLNPNKIEKLEEFLEC